jgi:hypothetical protein
MVSSGFSIAFIVDLRCHLPEHAMPRIDEVTIVHSRRVKIKKCGSVPVPKCLVCRSDAELVSVGAVARLMGISSARLCEKISNFKAVPGSTLHQESLVCLGCVTACLRS